MIKESLCQRCENKFYFDTRDNKKGKFCSRICFKNPIKKTNCLTCKKDFSFTPLPTRQIRKYCSNKCAVSYDHLTNEDKYEIMKEIFYKNIQKQEDGCELWIGSKFPNGYGRLRFHSIDYLVHRFAYELYHGNIDSKKVIQHSCDVRNCISRFHLSEGTHKTNYDDCHSKNRHMYGDNHVHAVLTVEQVKEIKKKLRDGISRRLIVEEYQIKTGTLTALALGKTWKHVTLEE